MKKYGILLLMSVFAFSSCGGLKTDSALDSLINDTVANCDFGDSKGYKHSFGWKIEKCKNDETKKTKEWIRKNGVAKALPSLIMALGDKNEKKAATAVYSFNWSIGLREGPIAKNPALLTDKAAKLMMENFKKVSTNDWAQYAARAITRLAVIKGLSREVIALADSLPDKSRVKSSIYSNLMVYGGMANFEKIKALTTGSNKDFVRIGIRAPSSISTMKDEYLNELCPWWKGFLSHEDKYSAGAAAAQIGRLCSGDVLNDMMDEVEKRYAAEKDKMPSDFKWAVKYITCEKSLLSSKVRGTADQCKRRDAMKKKMGIK